MDVMNCSVRDLRKYFTFIDKLYSGNHLYRASMQSTAQKILSGKSTFCRDKFVQPLMVSHDEVQAVGTLIYTKRAPHMIQIAFMEMSDNEEALSLLIGAAKEKGREVGAKKVVVGINGHLNYGLGILSGGYEQSMSFGNAWNPDYYDTHLTKHAADSVELHTYLKQMDQFEKEFEAISLPPTQKDLIIRPAIFSQLNKEAQIFNSLSNQAFQHHPFYYERSIGEDYELLKMFKPILKPNNLLIAELDGMPVGYLLWYPDFNELIRPGKAIGLNAYLRNKFQSAPTNIFRGVQIAVLPEHQRTGIGISLMKACHNETKNQYQACETGWVVDTNIKSREIINKWTQHHIKPHKSYKVYSIDI